MSTNSHAGEAPLQRDPSWMAPWRGIINSILYSLTSQRSLADPIPAMMAKAMVDVHYFEDGPSAYANAIPLALAHDGPITTEIGTPHSEREFRAFLACLAGELDSLRPWSTRHAARPARARSIEQRIAEEAARGRRSGR